MDLRNSHAFVRSAYETTTEVFNTLTLKQVFWKTKILKQEYIILAETAKIKTGTFPYKTAPSDANAKTNRMVITKCTYFRERSFASN